jgi:hypothetical protein
VNFAVQRTDSLENARENADCTAPEFCHDVGMAKIKRLLDTYRFPGFVPFPSLRGVFGDHRAIVIRLRRRQKKQCAASAARPSFATTTNGLGKYAISPAETDASTWPTKGGVSSAHGVRP